jgi:hypothetical protein
MTQIKCAICLQFGDPMSTPPADTTVKGYSVCTRHIRIMDQFGDIKTVLAELKRNPQKWVTG